MIMVALSCGLHSCVQPVPDPGPDGDKALLEVKLKSADQTSAEIGINAKNILEIAYVVRNEQSEMTMPAVLFATGNKVDPAETSVKLTNLDAAKTYWVYFAAKVDAENFYEEILELEVKTTDYTFDKLLTLVDNELMGYSVRITVPESVRKEPEKYGIRFSFGSLPDVIDAKYGMGETWAANLINNGHGCMGWQETQKDTTVTINPYNEYRPDGKGGYEVDPSNGEMIYLHAPIAPGEPYIFVAGEYRYGDIAETGWGWTYGSPEKDTGYFIPLWRADEWIADKGPEPDRKYLYLDEVNGELLTGEEEYWDGALQPMFFRTQLPEELDTDFEVIIENVTAVDATLSFIPDEKVYCYSYFICNDDFYNTILENYLLGHEDWMQWFVCSYFAMRSFQVATVQGPMPAFQASSEYGTGGYLNADDLYHVFVTATSDENGTSQKFFHETFTTTEKQYDAPLIEVTAVEDGENVYFAKFNVKAPNKDVETAKYGANYKRDFILDFNSGEYNYEDFAQNAFTTEEIAMINSDEGLEIMINSTDGEVTRCVVVGYNCENTRNQIWSPEKVGPCPAVADCKTKLLPMVPRIDSPLFDQLEGVWTLSARMLIRSYDANNNIQEYSQLFKNKVEIMNTIDLPELTDDVYEIYESYGMNKQAVDGLYEDLAREVEIFNNYRLTYRNRLLCLGWLDYDSYNPSRLASKSPYDLFTWERYSSYNNAQILYDFGPKWYLEVAADGTVTVPFDIWETPPMTNWQGTPFFMGALAQVENNYNGHGYKSEVVKESTGEVYMPARFPVEVVSKDQIIIHPVEAPIDTTAASFEEAKKYLHYPNAIGGWGQSDAQVIRPIISEITLKRGWTESSTTSSVPFNYVQSVELTGEDVQQVVVKSMTLVPEKKTSKPFRYVRPICFKTDEAYERYLQNSSKSK